MGDLGPSWSSAIGGGLGRRGELDGEAAMVAATYVWLTAAMYAPKPDVYDLRN